MTPGALNSSGRVSVAAIGPWPSSGLPSGSTTRPSRPSPTGTLMTAPERHTDVVLFEVERDADNAMLELEPLERDAVLEAVDARNAVADLQHRAYLGQVRLDVVLLDPGLEDRGDLFGA